MRHSPFCQREVLRVDFDAEGLVADSGGGGDSRARSHEGVEKDPLTQRQQGADEDAQELLRFEAGVVGNGCFAVRGPAAGNGIGQGAVRGEAAESAGFPAPEIVGHGAFGNGRAEEHPRFVCALGRHADFGKFLFGILGAVAAAEAVIKAHEGRADLETGVGHRHLDEGLEHRMARHANMRAGDQGWHEVGTPIAEEAFQLVLLRVGENGEPRERVAAAAADGGGKPPDAAAPGPEFSDFLFSEFEDAVGRVGANRVERARLAFAQPIEAVGVKKLVHTERVISSRGERQCLRFVSVKPSKPFKARKRGALFFVKRLHQLRASP